MFGQFGDLVDEADLGRQHAVRRVLGQLGAAQAHEQHAVVVAVERLVEFAHHLAHLFVVAADHDAVRAPAVGDGGAFLEEFRVGDDLEFQLASVGFQAPLDVRAQAVAGAYRDGRFLHHDDGLAAMLGDGIGHHEDRAEIGRAVLARRGADRDELHPAVFHGQARIAAETQAAAVQAFAQQGVEPGFVDAGEALREAFDLVPVDVHAQYIVAHFGEDGGLHQSYIATAEYADLHGAFLDG